MATLFIDPTFGDAERREELYRGSIIVYSPTDAGRSLCEFADQLIREAFGDLDPEYAQFELPVERYVAILKDLKPRFIHHPESKRLVTELLRERGCASSDTYYDVPRLRSSTSDGYLTTGIAYAWHPHRDTWYSAPSCQLNWWLPIYPLQSGNTVAFYPKHFDRVVPNDSAGYDYEEWNKKHRFSAAEQVKKDTRPLPKPTESIDEDDRMPIVCDVGGLIVFSGAQLHSSMPNNTGRTRFSIDFRTINIDDCRHAVGAPTADSHCSSTSARDFKRLSDRADLPEEVALEMEAINS